MGTTRRDRILSVDLSTGTVERERVPEEWRRQYLGGKGLGARYLYERLEAGTDPLGPENLIAFLIGPLSGYLPGESRYAVVTKSPLTGGFLDSYSGGTFADQFAGALGDCLGVLVTGQAEKPVRLVVTEGTCRIEPADTWGMDTVETDRAFPEASVACIGPAGEQTVAYATVASDAGDHQAGRGGAGAVMGAKRLKAVVASGEAPTPGPALQALRERYERAYTDHETGEWQAAGGTIESVDFANEIGALASRGWQENQFDEIEGIGIEAATDAASGRESGTVPGDFRFETEDGEVVLRGAGPMVLGAGLGIGDIEAVAALAESCDRFGVDVIEVGNAVAWAIHADEAGIVDCPVEFGDVAGAKRLIEAIAARGQRGDTVERELAETLADGIDEAADRFGGTTLVPTVNSMALPAYDPRGSAGMALAYATSDRGPCHRRARPVEQQPADRPLSETVRTVVGEQTVRSVLWSLIIDDFVGETMWEDLGSEFLAAIDRPYTPDALTEVGERIWTLTRLFNAREGFDRSDDRIPESVRPGGKTENDQPAFERTLDGYYQARGWGRDGVPTRETVDRLDLLDVVDEETPLGERW